VFVNHFEALGFEPAPWLDHGTLWEAVQRLGARFHMDSPDTAYRELYRQIQEAAHALRTPANTLRHFLELTARETGWQVPELDPTLYPLFQDVAVAKQAVQAWKSNRPTASSALTRALELGALRSLQAQCTALHERLSSAESALHERLRTVSPTDRSALSQACSGLIYLEKWITTVTELQTELNQAAG
jgi:signal transduction histidine kinase